MPYSSAKAVPKRVKKKGKAAARQWMHVWNSTHKKTGDEGKAFAAANSVLNKRGKRGAKELDVATVKDLMAGDKSVKVTLYSGADDPDLPEHVKALPTNVKSKWVNNYNWTVMDTRDDEDARDQADQYTSVSVDDLSEILGSKADGDASDMPAVQAAPSPVAMPPVQVGAQRLTMLERLTGRKAMPSMPGMFQVYKGTDGVMHTLLVYSNVFRDKEKEIFSGASHKEYAEAVESGEAPPPALHLWHGGPETEWGQVETISFVDSFAIAGGRVNPGKEGVALKLKEMADKGELAVSFGYLGLRGPDSVYSMYRAFEISPLPVGSEANPWTSIDFKESDMAFSDTKRKWLKDSFGYTDDQIVSAEKSFEAMGVALKQAGVAYKEGAGETAPQPTPQPPPAPPSPAPQPPPPNPVATAESTIMPQIEAMATAMGQLAATVGGLVAEVKGLKEAAPGAAAAAADANILARIAQTPGHSPANDPKNVVVGAKDQQDDWLGPIWRQGIPGLDALMNGQPGGAVLAEIGSANGTVPAPANGEVK